jgi:hypothetical protein
MCDAVTGAIVAGTLLSTGMQVYGMQQQKKALKQQRDFEQQKYALQQKQFKSQQEGAELEMRQKITERKRIAAREREQNRSALSGTNIDLDSPSFGAFFASNVDAKKRDVRNIRLMGTEKQLNAMYGVQQASIASAASDANYKSSRSAITSQQIGTAVGAATDIAYTNKDKINDWLKST